ncbi:MAG: fused MFS/spermidine synthase, partial [Actinomycetota bacterium]|nr:fused MFS/spermidine synthase [Actinomycetota bacterium]
AAGAGYVSSQVSPEGGRRLEGAAAQNWSPVYRTQNDRDVGGVQDSNGFDVVFQKDTQYHRLAVVDDQRTRYLRFDSSFQSGMDLDRPFATEFEYTDYFDLGLAYNPRARDVLFIGLGGGSAPKRLWRDFPQLRIQVVELDPVVADVSYRYFRLPRSPRLRVAVEDGRQFLASDERRWDVIAIDAYFADAIPFHLTTHEFLELARSRLKPGGVVLSNVIGALRGSSSQLFRSFYRTYRSVFPTVLVHPVVFPGEGDDAVRNIILVATEAAAPEKAFLRARWRELRARFPAAPDLRKAIAKRDDRFVATGDVPILTDDYAPTDALLLID